MQKNVYYSFKSRAKMEKKIPIAANYIFTKELKEKVEALEGIKGDKLVFKLNGKELKPTEKIFSNSHIEISRTSAAPREKVAIYECQPVPSPVKEQAQQQENIGNDTSKPLTNIEQKESQSEKSEKDQSNKSKERNRSRSRSRSRSRNRKNKHYHRHHHRERSRETDRHKKDSRRRNSRSRSRSR